LVRKSQLDSALQQVRAFLQSLSASSDWSTVDQLSDMICSRKDEGSFSLNAREAEQYRHCVAALTDATFDSGIVSPRELEQAVQTAIFAVLDIRQKRVSDRAERIKAAVRELRDHLTAKLGHHRVILRIGGLSDDSLPDRVGKVEFARFDESQAQHFRDAISHPDVPEGQQRERLEQIEEWALDPAIAGATIGIVEVDALDWRAAESLALAELRLTLDVINFFSDLIPYSRGHLRLPGDGEGVRVVVPQLTRRGERWTRYYVKRGRAGATGELSLRRLREVDAHRHFGFAHASRLLAAPRQPLEDQLLASLQWAGRATVRAPRNAFHRRREEAFLLYAIALESFVLAEGDPVELGYRLQLRVAHLLGETPDARRALVARVKQLYKVRSAIVHSGSFRVTDADLGAMRQLAKLSLIRACTSDDFTRMRVPDDLAAWFNDRLLGSVDAPE
jgi:hypothetical protein